MGKVALHLRYYEFNVYIVKVPDAEIVELDAGGRIA
jgi:hypothetical protein